MTAQRRTIRTGLAAGVGVLALVVAGCGATGSASSAANPPASGSLAVAQSSLGPIVVDGAGRTVYLLTADSPGHSTCGAACLAVWPAVQTPATGSPSGTGISATLGVTATPTGASTVTVGGLPVYTFAQDAAPGDTNGEGIVSFGGTWYAVSPAGTPVKPSSPSSTGGGYVRGY